MGLPIDDEELFAFACLARVPGLGARGVSALVQGFGSAAAVLAASGATLEDAGLSPALRSALLSLDKAGAAADLAWRDSPDKHLLVLSDPRYPALLAELTDAPAVLYVLGDPGYLSLPQLAIVGSRNPSAQGRENAQQFAASLTGAGLAITSGMALGIDGAAHQGALAAGGITLAVAGTGLDRIYPARHRALAHQIAEYGALVSEFPPGTGVRAVNFPQRNRIIAGLSLGTLVVEAALASGSLITARQAMEYGREVFAIPGSIHNPMAKGCHRLIRQGAKLIECANDILEELGPLAAFVQSPAPTQDQAQAAPTLDAEERAVLAAVDDAPTPVDRVVQRTGLPASVVAGALLGLELRGFLALCPGGYQRL